MTCPWNSRSGNTKRGVIQFAFCKRLFKFACSKSRGRGHWCIRYHATISIYLASSLVVRCSETLVARIAQPPGGWKLFFEWIWGQWHVECPVEPRRPYSSLVVVYTIGAIHDTFLSFFSRTLAWCFTSLRPSTISCLRSQQAGNDESTTRLGSVQNSILLPSTGWKLV